MIAVIADDLSGAAELAGIAAARGLKAEVQTEFDPTSTADLIAIDTQTRSLPPVEAAAKLEQLVPLLAALRPDWIYKKTDSVLRGNIRAELETLLGVLGKRRALFIPANPGKQRCIRQGRYFVNRVSLDESVFANDPDHPQRTADLVKALGEFGELPVRSLPRGEPVNCEGILMPDAESSEDLADRAAEVDDNTLHAGAAEFFTALLERRVGSSSPPAVADPFAGGGASLFVCGSLAAWDQGIGRLAAGSGIEVVLLQPEESFTERTVTALDNVAAQVMMAIGRPNSVVGSGPALWLETLARSAAAVLQRRSIARVFAEGGATASALMRCLGWKRFKALATGLLGVGCLRLIGAPGAPLLLIKPGSYPWPDRVWLGLQGRCSSARQERLV